MSLTLGLTGMDPATEAALKSAFEEANARLQGQWTLCGESDAHHVVVDMDSMYGPMSWLRLHAGGKHVIGLTSAPRTQTAFRLGRPFDSEQMGRLLVDLAAHDGIALDPPATKATSAPVSATAATANTAPAEDALAAMPPFAADEQAPAAAAAPVTSAPDAEPSPSTPPAASVPIRAGHAESAPAAIGTATPETVAQDGAAEARDTSGKATPTATPDGDVEPAAATAAGDPSISPEPSASPEPPAPPREPVFADWLVPGALTRRVRYQRTSGPTLYLDPGAQAWHGPTPLKPIAGYFDGTVAADAFEPVDEVTWARDAAAAGPAQPFVRLRWLGGLVAGRGALLPGFDPDGRYQLTKWPQTEREYPKHFRIATAMMKGPATVAEIADASAMPAAEVADFFNANLATGFVEFVPEPPPAAPEPPKPAGLFGRLRNR